MTATAPRPAAVRGAGEPRRRKTRPGGPRDDYLRLEALARRGWRIEVLRGDRPVVNATRGAVALSADGATVGEATDALLQQLRRPSVARAAGVARHAISLTGDDRPAGRDEPAEQTPPSGPLLTHDLLVHGLPAREASRLRDIFARAGLPIDVDAPEDSLLVPCASPRPVSLERVLAVLRAWAKARRITQLPVVYGTNEYVLAVEGRDAEAPAEDHAPAG